MRGRGAKGKRPFVSAISLNEEGHPIYMRLSVISCLLCFNSPLVADIIHGSLPKNGREAHQYKTAFYWVDSMIGNVKN